MTHISQILAKRKNIFFAEHRRIFQVAGFVETQKKESLSGQKNYSSKTNVFSGVSLVSVNDFLKLPLAERLPLVTNPSLTTEDLHKGDRVRFDFSKNLELQQCISLSELLPKTVRKISVNGRNGRRDIFTGEYLMSKEERVTICNGTSIKIEEVQTLDEVTVLRREKLEKISQDITLNEFFNLPFSQRLQLITDGLRNPRELEKGNILLIQFHKNESLESQIGLCEVLPERIQMVEVTDNSGRKTIGRRNSNRFFMSEKEERLVILTGFTVQILR